LGAGLHLITLWQSGTLNPDRPLVSLTVILLVAGLQILLFGFLGSQIVQIRRELFRTQKAIKLSMRAPVEPTREDRSPAAMPEDEHELVTR
jgi:hypothetical protein